MCKKIRLSCPAGHLFDSGRKVCVALRNAGYGAYWVGGAVRDIFLQRTPDDIDLVTTARPEEVQVIFPDAVLVGASFGVVMLKVDGIDFEVATCREERKYQDGRHPEEIRFSDDFKLDMQRRDFTCNALLYDPFAEEIIDYVGGTDDLNLQLLRVVGSPVERFGEDYLRMFRAVRFAAKLGLVMDEECFRAIQSMSEQTSVLAAERVRDELESMLTGENPVRALELLKESGLLRVWLKEVDELSGVEQCEKYHPEGDVWKHTLLMFSNLLEYPEPNLAWSILLHDIGKKPTCSYDDEGIPHFYNHESVGGDMVMQVAERLRFSCKLAECVAHAVRNHMRFAHVCSMRTAKLRRLLSEEHFEMELELHRLDCLSSNGLMGTWEFLLQKKKEVPEKLPPPLVNGQMLIQLGYKPGPLFGTVLEKAMDAQLEGVFSSREEAAVWVKKIMDEKSITA